MKGFIEHNSYWCLLGEHSNRGLVRDMCPVYLELRRSRLKQHMRNTRYAEYLARAANDVFGELP
jgi:hypothetical protein